MLDLFHGLSHWQVDLLVSWLLLQGAVLSIFPEEVIILTMGLLWGQGKITFPEALFSIQLGLIPGNAFMMLFGRKFGHRFFLSKKGVQVAMDYFKRYGGWLVFFARFTPLVRGPIYLAAGISGFPPLSFIRIDTWASCFQISFLLLAGRWIEAHSKSIEEAYRIIGMTIGIGMISFILAILIKEFLFGTKKRTLNYGVQ